MAEKHNILTASSPLWNNRRREVDSAAHVAVGPAFVSENIVEIDLAALRSNYLAVERLLAPGQHIMPVVKSNGYGHGMVEVSCELEHLGCEYLAVFNLEEGVLLRDAGIRCSILVMKGIGVPQVSACAEWGLTPALYDPHVAELLNDEGIKREQPVAVHVKVDTGLGRLGVVPERLRSYLESLASMEGLRVEGIMSHLSDVTDKEYTRAQLDHFKRSVALARELGLPIRHTHAGNSAVLLARLGGVGDLVRPGLLLYGCRSLPFAGPGELNLKPVMRFSSRIMQIKPMAAGESVSYGRTYITPSQRVVAAIPLGYNDGYDRRFSNRAQALVHGRRVPVVGTICMNLTMLDVTDVPDVEVGDEVVLLGVQGEEEITADELALTAGTISYEILCGIGNRNRRAYRNGEA